MVKKRKEDYVYWGINFTEVWKRVQYANECAKRQKHKSGRSCKILVRKVELEEYDYVEELFVWGIIAEDGKPRWEFIEKEDGLYYDNKDVPPRELNDVHDLIDAYKAWRWSSRW